jgi:hypothetical protein
MVICPGFTTKYNQNFVKIEFKKKNNNKNQTKNLLFAHSNQWRFWYRMNAAASGTDNSL